MPSSAATESAAIGSVEPALNSYEANNRALALELDKQRQQCQIKEQRIIELNALNYEQREDNIHMAYALETARDSERNAIERYQAVVEELEKTKRYFI